MKRDLNIILSYTKETESGCLEWIRCIDKDGYPRAGFVGPNGESSCGKSHRVNRIVYELYTGKDITGLVVRHKCDNPKCINPKHLLSGTPTDNMLDRDKRGRHGCAKLSHDDVRKIRELNATGEYKQKDLASMFSVDARTISSIVNKTHFKHVVSTLVEV